MNQAAQSSEQQSLKVGPFWLVPDISRKNLFTLFSLGFMGMILMPFIAFIQPMMFQELLDVPLEEQGRLTANLSLLNDFIALAVMVYIGALADRTGRRIIMTIALVGIAGGFLLYPHADSITQLYIFRVIVALFAGTVTVMLTTIQHDYPMERSRAKLIGFNGIFTGFGVLFTNFVILALPKTLENNGFSSAQAIYYTFGVVALIALIAAMVARFGLYGGLPDEEHRTKSIFDGINKALEEAKANPRLTLSFLAGFAARGDLAIAGLYFALWFMNIGTQQGMESSSITKISGQYFGILSLSIMLWAPIFGYIADKLDRITAVILGLSIAGSGYLFMGSIENPFIPAIIIPACILLGMGESSAIISCASLAGQQAPDRIRGSVMGFFSLTGTLGILTLSYIGGVLFDLIGPTAPFIMMGFLNFIVVIIALYVRIKLGPYKAVLE